MWVVSTFLLILCNAIKSAKSPDFIFMFNWFKRNADWRVQVDNCCQRAKVHRLVTLPEQSCKMSWSCCGIFFSGVCVNFEYLEIWIHYFSKCNSAHHYFSKSNSAPHYFSKSNSAYHYFSKSNSAHHYFSKSNSAHHYFSKSNSVPHYLISSKCKKFYFLFLNVSQRLSFVLLGMEQCPIVVSKQFQISLLFLGLFDYVSNAISNYVQNF